MEDKSKNKKKSFNIFSLVIPILIILIIGLQIAYFYFMPVLNVYINGNKYLSDYEIMTLGNLKNNPPLYRSSSNSLKKKIKKNPLVRDVEVIKRFDGKLTLNITENKYLFLDRNNNMVILSGNTKVNPETVKTSVPTLINYVPNDIYLDLVKDFDRIDESVIGMISEIEYKPLYSNENIIDDKRFLLRMNDGNEVYINTVNIEQLNNYPKFYASLEDKKGVLNLDSSTKENFVFKPFKEVSEESES